MMLSALSDDAGTLHSAEAPALLRLEGVHRTYRMGDQIVAALDGIDLTIRASEFVAIIGQSGSGKSTLLNILGCLDRPSRGHYYIDGVEVGGIDPDGLAALRRHTFGFVFQSHNLLAPLPAWANVAVPAVFAGEATPRRKARANALLTRMGLGERLNHRPAQLSGGQQQRVGIARALMNGGRVILADEPTGALDNRTGADLLALFRTLCDEGHTVIIVTHDAKVAAAADRVVEIADGRICSDRPQCARKDRRLLICHQSSGTYHRTGQILEAVKSALKNLLAHRLRNILTMLGIVVGIAAVILAVAIGQGSEKEVLDRMKSLGNNVTQILSQSYYHSGNASQGRGLTFDDLERFSVLPFLAGATPSEQKAVTLRYRNRVAQAAAYGVASDFFRIHEFPITSGRNFLEESVRNSELEIIIDPSVRAALFTPDQDPIGAFILVGTTPARVVGIAQITTSSQFGYRPFVAMPYTTFRLHLSARHFFSSLTVQISEDVDRDVALAAVEKYLISSHGSKDFVVLDAEAQRAAMLRTKMVLGLVTLFMAGIAFVIAIIGVMNMMLVAVAERTREIGLLMALGARRSDVMLRFFVEAFTLCTLGGVLGTGLALALGEAARFFELPFPLFFGWRTVAAAVSSAALAGIGSGLLPARRAALVDPIDALAR